MVRRRETKARRAIKRKTLALALGLGRLQPQATSKRMAQIKCGDRLPDFLFTTMDEGGKPVKVSTAAVFADKKVVLFAVPGAFTPTCTKNHCPSFIANFDKIKEKGVHTIACTSVNDAFVMDAWAEQQRAKGKVTFLADGNGDFAKEIGMEKDGKAYGMGMRSKRYAMIVDNQIVKYIAVDENGLDATSAENILKHL
jgi:peroxiredoxin